MELNSIELALLFTASITLVGVITPSIRLLALKLDVVDRPIQHHKTHTSPVPYMGGVAIVIGVLITTYGAILWEMNLQLFQLASFLLVPALLMGIVGLIDDIKDLTPWPRFVIQNLVGLCIATFLVLSDNLGSPLGIPYLDILISVFWIVGISNSINFFDNIDGGASGAIAISALFLTWLAYIGGQPTLAAISVVLSGSTFGFLIWNRPPARIYMGDAGALFLGILISTICLRFNPSPIDRLASFSIPIFLLAVPILDTTTAVISRIRRGISPFQGGRDHLSHRLMRRNLDKRQSVIILWILNLFFCLGAFLISILPNKMESIFALLFLFVWVAFLKFFLSQRDS